MKRLATTLVLVLGALPAAAQAPQPAGAPLPVDERRVVDLALADHPHVLGAEAERDAAEAARSGAKRALVPDITLSGRYTRLSSIPAEYRRFGGATFPQILNNLGVRAELSVPVSDLCLNLAASARALGHAADASALELLNARAQIAYEARVAFLSYWRATLAVSTAEELVRAAETQANDQRAREAAGTVARNDVLTFEVALDAAVMQEQAARSELAAAEANLRSFFPSLGAQALVVPALPESEAEPESPEPPRAPARSSRIASLEEQAQAARERASSASLDRLPKLSLFAAGEYAAPSPRVFVLTKLTFIPTWEAGARLSWSLSQATVGSTVAEREAANHRVLRARVEELRRKLDAERTAALRGLELAHARMQRAGERVRRASALAAARRGELEAGTALPLNVVLAETDLARAKNDHVDAVVERALSLAKIDFVDGRAEPSRTLDGGAQ